MGSVREKEESSEEENDFILTKIFTKDQFKLQEEFRTDIEFTLKYLNSVKKLTEAFQSIAISGKSYHYDEKRQVPFSGWRYLTGYLKKVEFVGKNKSEAESFISICDQMGYAEEKMFAYIRNPDQKSNLFAAAGTHRIKVEDLYMTIQKSMKTCNRRRKKVEKAAILHDLRDQCPRYKIAVMKLDDECRGMENYRLSVRNNLPHQHEHMKKSLSILQDLSRQKAKILKGKAKSPNSECQRRSPGSKEKSSRTMAERRKKT